MFRWESLAAPEVSCSAQSLRGCISVLCALLSDSRCTCKISRSSCITPKATLHSPVYAGGFRVLLYTSTRSPKCSYNLRRNFCSLRDARQVYIRNTACCVHVCKARAVPVKFLCASRVLREFMIPPSCTLGLTRANTSYYVHVRKARAVPVKFLYASRVSQEFMIPPSRTLGLTRGNTPCYVHVRKARAVPVKFLRASRMPREFMILPSRTLGLTRANTSCYVHVRCKEVWNS